MLAAAAGRDVTGRLSGEELDRLLEHTSALLQTRWLLSAELYIKLDTFRADLLAEQEDRATPRPWLLDAMPQDIEMTRNLQR